MTYKEARDFIEQSNQYGSKLGLEAVTELLSRLGNPQDKVKVIHVSGTNGKGSTTAYLVSVLATEGYRVGRYISPAVFTYRERIQITDGEPGEEAYITELITKQGVSDTVSAIKRECDAMVKDGFAHPTAFEVETAMAFLYFVEQGVDFAVVEVGLGGRLDATNVMKKPLCCVITSISMDHMQYLGNDLTQITQEKAGIIKAGIPVVTGNKQPEVLQVLKAAAEEKEAPLLLADAEEAISIRRTPGETVFEYQGEHYEITLLGGHQIMNAVLAITALKVLVKQGYPISSSSLRKGLRSTSWSGRLEVIARAPYFILDGAHNEDAALKLAEAVREYFADRRIIYIMGVLADKDYPRILEHTAPLAALIITLTPNNSRALSSGELALEAQKYCSEVVDARTAEQAVHLAYERSDKEDVIIAFGSLSFMGELRKLVLNSWDLNSED